MVVDKKGKTIVIDKSKEKEYLSKGWKLAEEVSHIDENFRVLATKGMGAETKNSIKVGHEVDFYEPKVGNKRSGKITKMSGTGYEVQDEKDGKKYTFKFFDRASSKKLMGESLDEASDLKGRAKLFNLYTKAMKTMPGSPAQKKLKDQIEKLRKELGMDESLDESKGDNLKSSAYKLVHAASGKIIDAGSQKDMAKKMRELNKKNPKSHFVGLAPGKKVGDTFGKRKVDEAVKTTHVVIDTADGNKVVATASSEQDAKSSVASAERPPMNIKDKKTLKIVKLKKPVGDKQVDRMVGYPLKEGTWGLPDSPQKMAGLKKAMSKPIVLGKGGDKAASVIGAYIGDDELYDALGDAGDKNPKGDARPIITKWMKKNFVGSWSKYATEAVKYASDAQMDDFLKGMEKHPDVKKMSKHYNRPVEDIVNALRARVSVNRLRGGNVYTLNFTDKDSGLKVKAKKQYAPIKEAVSPAQQAAIAIAKKEKGEEPKKEGARADAMRAMKRGGTKGMATTKKDNDVEASDDDRKAASKNIIAQLRRAANLPNGGDVEFEEGGKSKKSRVSKVDTRTAKDALAKFDALRKPDEKENFQKSIRSLSDLKKLVGR